MERFHVWPKRSQIDELVPLFAPLLDFRGPVTLSPEAMRSWEAFQRDNRRRRAEVPEEREVKRYALASEPTQVLKIATLFEACRAVKRGLEFIPEISADTLALAIKHVQACIASMDIMAGRGRRHETRQQAEEILARIRLYFRPDPIYVDTIYVSRSNLTRKFCHNTQRKGALQADELYEEILPYLRSIGESALVCKEGKYEIHAFRAESNPPPGGSKFPTDGGNFPPNSPSGDPQFTEKNGANSPNSPHSSSYTPKSEKTPEIKILSALPPDTPAYTGIL